MHNLKNEFIASRGSLTLSAHVRECYSGHFVSFCCSAQDFGNGSQRDKNAFFSARLLLLFFTTTIMFEIYRLKALSMLFSGKIFFCTLVLFLEFMNIHYFSLGKFLERSSGRIKFKFLLQLKKSLTKNGIK